VARCPQCRRTNGTHADACPLVEWCCERGRRLYQLNTALAWQAWDGSRVCLLCIRMALAYAASQVPRG